MALPGTRITEDDPRWNPKTMGNKRGGWPREALLPEKNLRTFQKFHGLKPDGVVGPRTRRVLKRTRTRLVPNPQAHPRQVAKSTYAGLS